LSRWIVALGLSVLGAAAPCRAEGDPAPPPVIHVPPGHPCLDPHSLGEQISAWVGTTPVDPSLEIYASEGPPGSREARFQVRRGRVVVAERTFSPAPAGCVQREATMALAIALVLKASLFDEISAAPPPPPEPSRRALVVSAYGLRSAGLLPAPGWGGALQVAWVRAGAFGGHLWLGGTAAPYVRLPGTPGGFDASAYAVGLEACAHSPRIGRMAGALCAGAAGGMLAFRGRGFARSLGAREAWAAGAGSVLMQVTISRHIALEAKISMLVLLTPVSVEARSASGAVLSHRELGTFGAEANFGPALVF